MGVTWCDHSFIAKNRLKTVAFLQFEVLEKSLCRFELARKLDEAHFSRRDSLDFCFLGGADEMWVFLPPPDVFFKNNPQKEPL